MFLFDNVQIVTVNVLIVLPFLLFLQNKPFFLLLQTLTFLGPFRRIAHGCHPGPHSLHCTATAQPVKDDKNYLGTFCVRVSVRDKNGARL